MDILHIHTHNVSSDRIFWQDYEWRVILMKIQIIHSLSCFFCLIQAHTNTCTQTEQCTPIIGVDCRWVRGREEEILLILCARSIGEAITGFYTTDTDSIRDDLWISSLYDLTEECAKDRIIKIYEKGCTKQVNLCQPWRWNMTLHLSHSTKLTNK